MGHLHKEEKTGLKLAFHYIHILLVKNLVQDLHFSYFQRWSFNLLFSSEHFAESDTVMYHTAVTEENSSATLKSP